MTAIVGNSKNIKMVQHYILLTACRAFKRDEAGAKGALNNVIAILENVKVNKDLYKM